MMDSSLDAGPALATAGESWEAYGRLREGLHITGYSFERACEQLEWLLVDDRWALGGRFADVNAFMDSIRLDQFRAVAEQRKRIALRIKELQPEVSNRRIAKALGVGHDTVDRALGRGANAPAATESANESNGADSAAGANAPTRLSGAEAARLIARRENRPDWKVRQERIAALVGVAGPLPSLKGYPIILADPPWRYESLAHGNRAIENHYPTLDLEEICALFRPEDFAAHAVLYLWSPQPLIESALAVMKAWGFACRTGAVWIKDKIGAGYYFRNQHEPLLLGRRGEIPAPPESERVSSAISAPRGKHSEKPEAVHAMLERQYPELAKFELFRRGPARPGWGAWGNQLEAAE